MSAKKPASSDVASRLERKLAKIKAAQRRKFINEDILRLEKNGDISYETVRTLGVRPDGVVDHNGVAWAPSQRDGRREANHGSPPSGADDATRCSAADSSPSENPANSNLLPDKLPETPTSQENGNLIGDSAAHSAPEKSAVPSAQIDVPSALTALGVTTPADQEPPSEPRISCHEPQNSGNQAPDPLVDLLHRALAASKIRRGRPSAFDEHAKGQLVALLSVGMSMRQAAAVLHVSHTAVQKLLKADPALADEITAARFQAQLQPLACVIREARRSWKAATWLLKYLDAKIASHEETPDERRERQEREADEFFARASASGVKKRKVLG